jgi:crotonobetainyl-CoA:carnitine CoA-transferase CaiB-like acyl-CoA transferase
MEGVRVVEVAQFTFVPASGAVLADWGAEVIKVEHAVHGDAQRGLTNLGAFSAGGSFAPIMEHPNRSKRSIGLALEHPEGLEVLYELVRRADVFTTNFLPDARARLKIDVDDLRKINPKIIYVRGTALGARGPEAAKGGFDQSTYWCRAGSSSGVTPEGADVSFGMPGPAYGDSIGAMFIAGGISAALFARERTGEPSTLDASLLSTGAWANALPVAMSMQTGVVFHGGPMAKAAPYNGLSGMHRTSDGRFIVLSMLQPGRYFADFCKHIDREDLITDERFDTVEKLIANSLVLGDIIGEEFAKRPLAEWRERLATMQGQWDVVQNSVELGDDPMLVENGFVREVVDVDGTTQRLITAPIQFDETPADLRRAPTFAEHTDEILAELGLDYDRVLELKIAGAVT